ncbi:hypothetical protein L207DRAFT_557950 [Hyaloscypha variabilis F]|uniref:Glyoxylate reductase n=1 Tax=Hyaloscypha variabilis (strain UAMH 11265 / GT02V1 / F) TaxID=1149755 RepID=A0A2J6R4L7_HYAVF|nr:hypothetical protein L207DRAFT_557950 [Hyaloscypha variabilis F]
MSRGAALLIGKIAHARKDWEALASILELKEFGSGTRAEFLQNCKAGKYDNVVAIFRSNASTSITGRFDKELVSALPKSLKYICHNGAGYDNIDVDDCTKRGIKITSTPGAVNHATADIAIFLMIGALRQAHKPLAGIRAGKWRGDFTLGHDPNKKILGIIGMGGIGREVALRAKAFGMSVIYHNRTRLSAEREAGAKYVSLKELISQSDVISLNLALNESTRNILGKAEFAEMKTGVVIVNTARSGLIDTEAMIEALDSEKVYSVGLDVYDAEPIVDERLIRNPNIFILPHIGTATYETQKEMEELVLENLKVAVTEGRLLSPIAEQANL